MSWLRPLCYLVSVFAPSTHLHGVEFLTVGVSSVMGLCKNRYTKTNKQIAPVNIIIFMMCSIIKHSHGLRCIEQFQTQIYGQFAAVIRGQFAY